MEPWPNGQGLTNFYSVLNDGLITRRRVPRGREGYFLRAQFRSEARMFEHGGITPPAPGAPSVSNRSYSSSNAPV